MPSSDLEGYWKCCQEGLDPFSELPCDKNNPLEVSTCQRCGHWICDSCPKTEAKGKVPAKLVLAVELKSNPPAEPGTVARSVSTIKRMASTRLKRERELSNSPAPPALPASPEKEEEAEEESSTNEGTMARRMSSIKRMASTLRKENTKPVSSPSPEKMREAEEVHESTPKSPKEGKMARRMSSVKRMASIKLGRGGKRTSSEVEGIENGSKDE